MKRAWLFALPVLLLFAIHVAAILAGPLGRAQNPAGPWGFPPLATSSLFAALAFVILLEKKPASRISRWIGFALCLLTAAASAIASLPRMSFLGISPIASVYALLAVLALCKHPLGKSGKPIERIGAYASTLYLLLASIAGLSAAFSAVSGTEELRIVKNGWELACLFALLAPILTISPPSSILAKKRRLSPSSSSLIIVGAVVLASLGFTAAMSLYSALNDSRLDASRRLQSITALKKDEIEGHLAEMKAQAERIRALPSLAANLDIELSGDGASARPQHSLKDFLEFQRGTSELAVFALRDGSLDALGGPVPSRELIDAGYQALSSGKTAFIDLHGSGGLPYRFGFAAPVKTRSGREAVIYFLEDPYAWLYPLLSKWPIPSKSAENLIVRQDGNYVTYLNPLRFDPAPPLTFKVPMAETEVASVQAILGKRGIVDGRDYMMKEVMAYVTPIEGTPWFLVARENKSESLAEYYERMATLVVTIFLLAGLSSLALGFALRRGKANELKARLERQEEKTWLHDVISLSQSEVYVFEAGRGKILFANRGISTSLGYGPDELLSMTLDDFYEPIDGKPLLSKLGKAGDGRSESMDLRAMHRRKDGSAYAVDVRIQAVSHESRPAYLALATDISEQLASESERETAIKILALANESKDTRTLFRNILRFVRNWSGCQSVGIRLEDGDDYPYYEYSGFDEDFISKERSLCARDLQGQLIRDTDGSPVLECMCGNIIKGRFDPSKPFFTPGGSFWSNCTTALLASTSEADRQSRTRNRCNGEGYESVALIPLKAGGRAFGLLQLNDRRKGMFSLRYIELLEKLCADIGHTVMESRLKETLEARERNYRLLFNTMELGFALHEMVYDPEGRPVDYRFLEVNPAFERMTGLDAKAVVGRTVLEVLPGVEKSWIETYGRIATEGGNARFEDYTESINKYYEVIAYSPEKGRFATLVSDTTEKRRAELEQLAEKERLSVTLASIGDGVISTDEAGRVSAMNRMAQDMTGWSLEEARGKPLSAVFMIVPENDRERPADPLARILSGKSARQPSQEMVLIAKTGKEMIIADSGAPLKDKDGRTMGVVIVFRDVTEKRKLQEAIQRGEKLEALGTIAGGIAHDFNNLLGGIFGYLDLASSAYGPGGPGKKYLDKAIGVFERAKDLSTQLLTFSKGGSPIRKPGALAPLLRTCLEFALAGSNVKVMYDIAPDLPSCDFDPNQIQQVVDNLAINARQAMPEGGSFKVSARRRILDGSEGKGVAGDFVEVSCEDSGPGIPPEIMGRVFDPFFTTKAAGSGLGLATSYSIIKKHGGILEAESPAGRGAVFRLYLPATQAAPEQALPSHEKARKAKGRILAMDDEEFILDILDGMLGSMGFACVKARDGKEALEILRLAEADEDWAAIILDLTIPDGLGGLAVIKEMRAGHPELPIYASSGYSDDPAMSDPAPYGFSGAIRKPYLLEELKDILLRAAGSP
jgi:PAS domain S-box-containing protein